MSVCVVFALCVNGVSAIAVGFCGCNERDRSFFCANRMKKRNNAYCVFFVYAYLETLVAIFCAFILEKRLFSGVSRQTKCPLINICESLDRALRTRL